MKQFNYQLTLNNSTTTKIETLIGELKDLVEKGDCLAFYIGATEHAPSTGMLHNHILVCYDKEMSMRDVKKCFSNKEIHIEACRGNIDENISYASKDGELLYCSTPIKPLRENKKPVEHKSLHDEYSNFLEDVKKQELEYEELAEKYAEIYIKYNKTFRDLFLRYHDKKLELSYKDRYERLKNAILYGGRSRKELEEIVNNMEDTKIC